MQRSPVQSLNFADLDVEALESRLELSVGMVPQFYSCGTYTEKCNSVIVIPAVAELSGK